MNDDIKWYKMINTCKNSLRLTTIEAILGSVCTLENGGGI